MAPVYVSELNSDINLLRHLVGSLAVFLFHTKYPVTLAPRILLQIVNTTFQSSNLVIFITIAFLSSSMTVVFFVIVSFNPWTTWTRINVAIAKWLCLEELRLPHASLSPRCLCVFHPLYTWNSTKIYTTKIK